MADDIVAFHIAAERDVIGEIAVRDDYTSRVDASIAGKSLQSFRVIEKLPGLRLRGDRAFQLQIFFRGRIKSDVQLVRNHSRDPIGIAIWQTHHAANVTHHALCFQFSKRNDLRDATFTVFLADVFQNFAAARFTKIDIDIRRRYPIGI